MELRVLRYFLAVAREENISKAAVQLHTTQPNLSRQMQNLEDEIGRPLFVRGSRKITLTEAGRVLQKRAEEITDLYDKTEMELRADDENIVADIHIGCGESYAIRLLAKAARLVREEHPGIKLHIMSGNSELVTERLAKGLLDFGVLIHYDNLEPYDSIRLPLTDTWGVLMRQDSPLASKETITANDLREQPLVYSQQAKYNKSALSRWFEHENVKPNIVATYNLIYNASLLVEEGIGHAVSLDRLINTSGNSHLCFRPLAPRLESYLDVAWKKGYRLPRAAKIFLEKLNTVISESTQRQLSRL